MKNLTQRFVAMNLMKKCAKLSVDIPSGSGLDFFPASEIQFSKTTGFVYKCVEKSNTSEQIRWHFPIFSF